MRREDDRVTKWIRQNWSMEQIGAEDYEYAMVVARLVNWPDTLKYLTDAMMPSAVRSIMESLAADGHKVWGNAYVVTTHGLQMPKVQYLEKVLQAAYEALGAGRWLGQYKAPPTLKSHHERLMKLEGLASFMAAQVIADLKNSPGHYLQHAHDWSSFSAPGPGSMRGLDWFVGRRIAPKEYQWAMESVAEYLRRKNADHHLFSPNHQLINMQDLQNCLCEYDKYMRVKNGTGRSKRSYPGA